jgi:hypothetical protein
MDRRRVVSVGVAVPAYRRVTIDEGVRLGELADLPVLHAGIVIVEPSRIVPALAREEPVGDLRGDRVDYRLPERSVDRPSYLVPRAVGDRLR